MNERNKTLAPYFYEHLPKATIKDMYNIYSAQTERCVYTGDLVVRAKEELFVIRLGSKWIIYFHTMLETLMLSLLHSMQQIVVVGKKYFKEGFF